MKAKLKLLFVALFTMLLFVACSSGDKSGGADENIEVNKEGFPIVDEELEMSLMAPGVGIAEWEDMPALQEYAEKTNISFKYNTPPSDDFATNLNLAFSSGDVADIIYAAGTDDLTPGDEVSYGEQGILLPLEDLIDEYAPNIKALFEENPDIEKSVTTNDGHIYSLPMVSTDHRSIWPTGPIWYNGKWLDALDVEELPKTTDEFYDLLVRFRDEDPNGNGEADEIPLSNVEMESIRPFLLSAFGLKEQDIQEFDGEVVYGATHENYKEYLKYMNKLYDEKLLDNEVYSQSDDQKKAKGQENRLGAFTDYFSYFTTGETDEEAVNNPMFHPLTSEFSDEPMVPISDGIVRGTFSLTKDNPSPEASIRWVDYFYSEEGGLYINQGPEGYLWEWDEDGEKKIELETPEGYDSSEDYRATIVPDYGISVPKLGATLRAGEEGYVNKEKSVTDEMTREETKEKMEPFGEVPYPKVYLTNDEQKEINDIQVDLESYVEQMEAKFITGVESIDDKWDDYVETIEKMNLDRYIEIYQDAYDRWNEG